MRKHTLKKYATMQGSQCITCVALTKKEASKLLNVPISKVYRYDA
jgi:hypothetical protein